MTTSQVRFGLLLAMIVVSCARSKVGNPPDLVVEVNGQAYNRAAGVLVDPTSVQVGSSNTFIVRLTNAGGSDLVIKAIREKAPSPYFSLETPQLPFTIRSSESSNIDLPLELDIRVVFTRTEDKVTGEWSFIIESNDKDAQDTNYEVVFKIQECTPHLVLPSTVDIGRVNVGEVGIQQFELGNTAGCTLWIDAVQFTSESDRFSLFLGEWNDTTKCPTPQDGALIPQTGKFELPEQIPIAPRSSIIWTACYAPNSPSPASARLAVFAPSDPDAKDGRVTEILANTTGPCIEVKPNPVEFGAKIVGSTTAVSVQIKSCGTEPLVITDIYLKNEEGLSDEFSLDFARLPGGSKPTKDAPLEIAPGYTADFDVDYTPSDLSPIDPNTGSAILDRGVIVFENNSFTPKFEVEVTGHGVLAECPTPVIVIAEGEEVPPQTTLHLYGDQSVPANGSIRSWQWRVDQPSDNVFTLLPSMSEKNVTHQVNVAGTYKYCLDVCDASYCSNDSKCGTTACKTVLVTPPQALHVELTWVTPGDPNPYDEGEDAGSDMDLHLVHPYATGPDLDNDGYPDGWFDISYDCFWWNCKQCLEWESIDPNISDNPCLDRDDTDGAGPENVNLDIPKPGRTYKVAVHYWDDHGYGVSYPRVKIYCYGQLAYDVDLYAMQIGMFTCDLWEVATIHWPDCRITSIQAPQGGPKIVHRYQNPDFVAIGVPECK
jgi:hypothetical protein